MVGPPSLFAIQGDPEAMHYTYCSPSREATATRLEEYAARFAEDGFESWTAVLATEDRVVGWGGLNKDPGEPEWGPEIAYYFDWACWARGLATELVLESLAYGFDDRRHGRHCPSQGAGTWPRFTYCKKPGSPGFVSFPSWSATSTGSSRIPARSSMATRVHDNQCYVK